MINYVKNWFWRSETILWARAQVAFGIVWGVVSIADMSPLLTGKWMTIWFIFNGIVTELLRRRGSVQQTVIVSEPAKDGTVAMVPKSSLIITPPGP